MKTISGRRRAVLPALLASTMLTGVSAAYAEDNGGLETVIVTAQKRTENLQRVPVSIQAITAEKLDELHLTDFTDFARYMPSVTYAVSGQGSNGGPGSASITMRGIVSDQNGNHSGPVPTVGVYLDEQPITTIGGTLDVPTYDVERVEALSGPQGTLYGASSESGTIRIITNKPDASGFAANYEADVNSVDHGGIGLGAHGMVNIPLADNIAIRIVAWDEHDAGYIDNVRRARAYTFDNYADPSGAPPPFTTTPPPIPYDNAGHTKNNYNTADKLGLRAALQIDLDDNWTVTPTITAEDEKSKGVFGFDPSIGDLKVAHSFPEFTKDKWYQAALTVQGKVGNLDLVYSGGYMDRKEHSSADYSDYTYWYDQYNSYYTYFHDNAGNLIDPTQNIVNSDHFTKESHELRLSTSKDDPLRMVAGAFYEKQTHFILQDYLIANLATSSSVTGWPDTLWLTDEMRVDRDYAVFGELAYDILPDLTLTGGVRFFKADNSLKGFFGFGSYEARCAGRPASVDDGPCTNLDARIKDDGETHKINLTWQIDDQRMVYATYSTGFRPGGVNRRTDIPGVGPYAADSLDNYEIGWKTSWEDNRLRLNGALFWENWNKFQFPFLGPSSVTIIASGGQARITGAEFDFQWLPVDDLILSGSGAYTNAVLTQDYCHDATLTSCPGTAQAPSGTQLPITPKWKLNATARYEFMVGDHNAHVQGSIVHQSGTWSDLRIAERSLLGKNEAFTTFDFAAGAEHDNWNVELYVQNAFDERAQLGRYAECTPGTCGFEPYILTQQPRTVGLRVGQKF